MALSQINFDFGDLPPQKKEDNIPLEKVELPVVEPEVTILPETENPKTKRGRKSTKPFSLASGNLTVPEDDILFQKQYYSIGDVSVMFDENNSTIRYWANEFTILKPKKNKKGDRFFRPEDIKNLKMIYHLLRDRKYTIEGAKEFIKNNKAAGEKHAMIEELEKIRLFLLELKSNL